MASGSSFSDIIDSVLWLISEDYVTDRDPHPRNYHLFHVELCLQINTIILSFTEQSISRYLPHFCFFSTPDAFMTAIHENTQAIMDRFL